VSPPRTGEELQGIAGSHGVAIARAVVISPSKISYPRRRIAVEDAHAEWRRFEDAVLRVQSDLRAMLEKIPEGRAEASILEAYVLMVGDEAVAKQVHGFVHDDLRCADWAVVSATDALAHRLAQVDDPYMRERSHDIEFVGERLLRAIVGGGNLAKGEQPGLPRLSERSILVAHDLSPAETAGMAGAPVAGIVTEMGSRTSHTSIMARAFEIPAVVGVQEAMQRIGTGDLLVVDGLRGRVVVNPDEDQLADATRRLTRYQAMVRKLGEHTDELAVTEDGTRVRLLANIELPEEAVVAREHGAEGVGLYRTEFLYVNRSTPPPEDEQLDTFRRVLEAMPDLPVTLRTFDIGGDKFVTTFRVPEELNPMLGLRALRLALQEPDVFLEHLRAMVRASAFGSIRIMLPMVSTVDEFDEAHAMVEKAKRQVREAGHPMAADIPVGAMIEVPSAAVTPEPYARRADFLSIGTNDLVQYTLAVDRTNRRLAHLASPFDPSILRLIRNVIEAGKAAECPVSLCGEMASEPFGALLLLGLGLRDVSMEAVAIPEVKAALGRVQLAELEDLAAEALKLASAREVEGLLADALEARLRDLLTGMPNSSPGSLLPPPVSSHG
jgi:phosphotransferase system enzyme I (PtsI)